MNWRLYSHYMYNVKKKTKKPLQMVNKSFITEAQRSHVTDEELLFYTKG